MLGLLHSGNWSGLSSANIRTTAFEYLSDRFRVLAFDRIGCGLTDNPETIDAYRDGTEVEHTLTFLQELGIERCNVAESSRGAGLATRLAVEAPERFQTLIMINRRVAYMNMISGDSTVLTAPTTSRAHR
ncbi:alpha/beta fold hydrolase [Halobellus marinus]|uniref:alpha/beta fold hydrolase n=1 Tax=Halobellus TaxID=1073986 RepID=UPI003619DABD